MSSTSRPVIWSTDMNLVTRRKAIAALRSMLGNVEVDRIRSILRKEGDSGLNPQQYLALDLALQDARQQELGTASSEQSTVALGPSTPGVQYGIIPDSSGNVQYQPVSTPSSATGASTLSQIYLTAAGLAPPGATPQPPPTPSFNTFLGGPNASSTAALPEPEPAPAPVPHPPSTPAPAPPPAVAPAPSPAVATTPTSSTVAASPGFGVSPVSAGSPRKREDCIYHGQYNCI